MRVALVHDSLHTLGGAERVLLALSEIFPDAPIYTPLYNSDLNKYFRDKKIITSYLQKWHFLPTRFLFPFLPGAIESFDFANYDLVISSSNSYAKNIITGPATKHISYIHSPMRYVWDSAHTYSPAQTLPWPLKSWVARLLHQIRLWDQMGASRVDIYVANSKTVKDRIRKYYRHDAQIIYPPVEIGQITPTPNNQRYFLAISRLSPYKRIDLAVEACTRLGLPLVVIGDGEQFDHLKKIAGPTVKMLGFVSDEEKYRYLSGCRALIFPGEEDFGIVPVEAMAAGKPVLAFNKGGLTETVIDGKTGLFFERQEISDVVEVLKKFMAGESNFNWQGIREHSEQFSVENFKAKILKLVANESR